MDITGYIHIDFDGFKDVIDAMGGVDIELTRAEAEALTEDTYNNIWFSEGANHLDGDGALPVMSTWKQFSTQLFVSSAPP